MPFVPSLRPPATPLLLRELLRRRMRQPADATQGPILPDAEVERLNQQVLERQLRKPPLSDRVASDATARPGYTQPPKPVVEELPRRSIGPQRRGVVTRRLPELATEELETGGALGIEGYGLQDVARDVVAGGGAFAPNKPGGQLLDLTQVPGAARMGYQAAEALGMGRPVQAGVTAALAAVPLGALGRKSVKTATSKLDQALSIWKAGLLTNPTTHLVNTAGNISMAAAESVKDIPAAAIDAVISAVRGSERSKAISLRGLVTEQVRGASKGAKAALRTLARGAAPEEMAKWDARRVDFGDGPAGKLMRAYTESVFRPLSASDAFFRSVAFGRALEEGARIEAKRMVKAGTAKTFDEALDFLRNDLPPELMADAMLAGEVAAAKHSGLSGQLKKSLDLVQSGMPLKKMSAAMRAGQAPQIASHAAVRKDAERMAEMATFQQPNVLAEAVLKGRETLRDKGGPLAEATTHVIAPFVRTPANIASTLVQYSPIGVATALFKQIRTPSQKKLAEDLGRSITGSGLVWLGWALAEEGKATGSGPQDASDRAQWDLAGKQPNSVRIGDQWLNLGRLAPVGALISVGAQMREAARESDTPLGAVAAAAYTPARVALDQTFLKGVSGALEAVNDPTRYAESFLENTAGSLVPAGVAAVARGVDPVQRSPQGLVERVQSRIPFASMSLTPRRDPLGRSMPSRGGVASQLFDFTSSQSSRETDLIKELARLNVQVGYLSRYQDIAPGRAKDMQRIDPAIYATMLSQIGSETRKQLESVLRDPQYQQATDAEKAIVLQRIITATRKSMRTPILTQALMRSR